MIVPQPLQPGDKIGLIAPSRKISPAELDESIRLLKSWGYQVELSSHLFSEENQFAGSDQLRADDLMEMIVRPEIKAILCARGGYGTVRILDKINPNLIRTNPKWLIGYSDITVLHSIYHEVVGMETLHAVMPINCNPSSGTSDTWNKLKEILCGDIPSYAVQEHPLNRSGKVSGTLVGGNLSVLYSLRGTFCDLNTDGKILFIEDLDEYLYHIDRMIMNLKTGGKLKNLKGLIVGGMSDMKDNTVPFGKTAEEIIADAVKEYKYPVLFGFPAGHCEPNLPLIFGRSITLDIQNSYISVKY